MRIIRDVADLPECQHNSVLALGNFDGVHKGHQSILQHVVDMAAMEGAQPAVMTFAPHPREFFSGGQPVCIYRFRQKAALLKRAGVATMFALRFNRKLASMPAKHFVEDILHGQLGVQHVVTGYNFAFGKGREGTTEFLAAEGHRLGFGFTALPALEEDGQVISTSAVRQALAAGDINKASHMLGHSYRIEGHVQRGDQRGRTMGFPTANIAMHRLFTPRYGVYAARGRINGEIYDGVANLGLRPTFAGKKPRLEVHLFDFEREIYGQLVQVELAAFIREEQSFSGIDALKAQIEKDVQAARTVLRKEQP